MCPCLTSTQPTRAFLPHRLKRRGGGGLGVGRITLSHSFLSSFGKQHLISGIFLQLPLLNKEPLNQICPLTPLGSPSCLYFSIKQQKSKGDLSLCVNFRSSEQLCEEDELGCSCKLFNYSTGALPNNAP